eukprot:6067030-Prymnesium_polylepis.1
MAHAFVSPTGCAITPCLCRACAGPCITQTQTERANLRGRGTANGFTSLFGDRHRAGRGWGHCAHRSCMFVYDGIIRCCISSSPFSRDEIRGFSRGPVPSGKQEPTARCVSSSYTI